LDKSPGDSLLFKQSALRGVSYALTSDPLRVVMFNPETNRAENVSHAIAQEILRRLDLEARCVPSGLEDFIDRHVGKDRQLTLRLALT